VFHSITISYIEIQKNVIVSLFFKCAILKQRVLVVFIGILGISNFLQMYGYYISLINRCTLGNLYQDFFMIISNTIFIFGH